jgi:hypothetical protein
VKEAMDALWKTFRTVAKDFVNENRSPNGLETWALACYQVTHVPALKMHYVDTAARGASIAFTEDGYESESDVNETETSSVERTDLISFPWLWAHGAYN